MEVKISIPDYMVEKLEENLKLFREMDELTKKLNQRQRTFDERHSDKTHEEKLLNVLWHGLHAHENTLNERIEYKKSELANLEKGD